MPAVSIPVLLLGCKFIRLKNKSKEPCDSWTKPENQYDADSPALIKWLESGGNYGVLPRGEVCILDADEAARLKELGALDIFSDTYTVRTGSANGEHYHYYFICSGLGEKKIPFYGLTSGKEHLGELYPAGSTAYCVGPGCIHPSGNRYEITNDAPLKVLTPEQIDDALFSKVKSARDKKQQQEEPKKKKVDCNRIAEAKNTLTDTCRLRIDDIGYPAGEVVQRGDEIQGSHPVHGSTTGSNYSINTRLNCWKCFRCDGGGDPAMFIAVQEGIIRCEDALPGALDDSKVMQQVTDAIKSGTYGKVAADLLIEKEKKERLQYKLNSDKQKQQQKEPETVTLKEHDDTPLTISKLNLTDIGNGLRFKDNYGEKFRFDHTGNTWYLWNGQIWQEDTGGCVKKAAQYTIAKMAEEIEVFYKSGDEKAGDAVYKHMKRSASERARNDMLRSASPHMAVEPGVWNSKPNLMNLQNGTFELDALIFRDFRQGDYLTFKAGVKYDPAAPCPEWLDHLNLVFGGDIELISAFQLMAGYSLLSGNPAQVFFILYGAGKNGKSVTVNTLRAIMGDYGIHVAPQTLMQQKNPDKIRSDLVRLQYKRLVTSTEGERGAKLDIGWIKQMTGGEPIVAAAKYKNEIEFTPEFALWFATNHLPEIKEVNEAIWRRLWPIPFNQVIPEDKRITDYEKKLIESEGSGIFNWMIEGLKRYYEAGHLIKPQAVIDLMEEYKEDEDPIHDYLTINCMDDDKAVISSTDIYQDYQKWCELNGIKYPISQTRFSTSLIEHGYERKKTNSIRVFIGLRFKTQAEISDYATKQYRDTQAIKTGLNPSDDRT